MITLQRMKQITRKEQQQAMKKKHRTTLNFPPELWKETKIEAIKRGCDAQDLVIEALRAYLRRGGVR